MHVLSSTPHLHFPPFPSRNPAHWGWWVGAALVVAGVAGGALLWLRTRPDEPVGELDAVVAAHGRTDHPQFGEVEWDVTEVRAGPAPLGFYIATAPAIPHDDPDFYEGPRASLAEALADLRALGLDIPYIAPVAA